MRPVPVVLAVTPEGLPLGVLGMKTWGRPDEGLGKSHRRKTRSINEKESVEWFEGLEHLGALKTRCAQTRLVAAGDRESDLYELFAPERPEGVDWLIRASENRCATHAEGYVWQSALATSPLGHTEFAGTGQRQSAPTDCAPGVALYNRAFAAPKSASQTFA